jgi:hypothetical protein
MLMMRGSERGDLHDGDDAVAAKGVLALQRDDEIEALVQDRGIEPDGAQHRQQLAWKNLRSQASCFSVQSARRMVRMPNR